MADAHGEHRDEDGPGLAEIDLIEERDVRLVAVAGELDISNVGALEAATFDLPNGSLGLIVDLSAASYIDSAALGLLFGLSRALRRRGQALRVVCPPQSTARRVLELTGFDGQSTDDDRQTAIATVHATVPLKGSAQDQAGAAQEQTAAAQDQAAAAREQTAAAREILGRRRA